QRIARVGSWEWRIGSNRAWWSDELYRILDFDRSKGVPEFDSFLEKVHPDDREDTRSRIQMLLRDSVPHRFDYRIILPDGNERVIITDAHLERDSRGNPYRFMGTCQDIT